MKLLEGCMSLSGPGASKPLTDITALSDTAQKFKGGRPNYGKIGMECAFDPIDPSHLKLFTAFALVPGVAVACEVAGTENGAKAAVFSAMFDELGLSIPNEGPVMVKSGATITTAITLATATSITPSAIFAPIVGQGTVLGLWVTSAYVTILGATNFEISGASRAMIPVTALSAAAPTFLAGVPNNGKLTFDLLWDSSDANHALLFAAYQAANQTDRIKITLTNTAASTITLNPVIIDGFEFNTSKDAPNLVKVSATINTPIAIV